jgi:hypothetical protein
MKSECEALVNGLWEVSSTVTYQSRFLFLFLGLALVSCGGGSANGGGSSGPPAPSFSLSLCPTTITLAQGALQNVQVLVEAKNGFSGSVSTTVSGLPIGVTVSPSSLSLTPGTTGTFAFTASKMAQIGQASGVVNGTSGALSANASLQFAIGRPVAFHMIGGEFSHGFYDEARQLLFIANFGLNEVDVISGIDLSVQARVSAPQPFGIDQMADGATLVIGTLAQQILTLDENSLTVTSHPLPDLGTLYGLFYPNVVALANGRVLIIGQEPGISSNDILDGGQYVIEWNSNTGSFTQVEPTNVNPIWETDHLARSADHKWAVFSSIDEFFLYNSDADTFTSVPLATVNPPPNQPGVVGYAMSADGTKIVVVSGQHVTFLDRSFNVLGITPIPGAFQNARTAEMFTPDESKVLLQYSFPLALEVLDTKNYAQLGYYSGASNVEDNDERLLAIDSNGLAFAAMSGGIRVIDMTGPIVANPTNGLLVGTWCPLPSTLSAPLNMNAQLGLNSPPPFTGNSYYVGGQPASVLSGGTEISIPASSTAGPVDIECVGPDGNTFVYARTFAYGVDTIGVSANFAPPIGDPSLDVYGFGFSSAPTVSIGGQTVPTLAVSDPINVLQYAQVHVPNGTANNTVGVTVTSANGTGSLTQAVTYIPDAHIVPASGLLQVLFDPHRNLLYVLKATEVDVLNPSSLQWQSPIPLPTAGGAVSYNLMALSPDGAHLVVESASGKLAIVNPDNPSQASTAIITSDTDGVSQPMVITKNNQVLVVAPVGAKNNVVDLSTLTVTSFTGYLGQLVRASADGSTLYGVDLNVSSGPVYSIDPATFAVQASRPFGYIFWTDLAVSSDGSQFAAIDGSPGSAGDIVGFYNSAMNLLNFNVYPLVSQPDDVQVLGSVFSPGGKVLVVPLGDSIEFWDAASGTLRARLATPEELNILVYPEGPVPPQMALDATGQMIFAISASGLTVLRLPETIDNLPGNPWSTALRASVHARGHSIGLSSRMSVMNKTRESKVKPRSPGTY